MDWVPAHSYKKTRMKSKTSHQSNENFAWGAQFPVVLSIVNKTQNCNKGAFPVREMMALDAGAGSPSHSDLRVYLFVFR